MVKACRGSKHSLEAQYSQQRPDTKPKRALSSKLFAWKSSGLESRERNDLKSPRQILTQIAKTTMPEYLSTFLVLSSA